MEPFQQQKRILSFLNVEGLSWKRVDSDPCNPEGLEIL